MAKQNIRIKFKETCASSMVHYNQGDVVDLPEGEATELVAIGRAELAPKADLFSLAEKQAKEAASKKSEK